MLEAFSKNHRLVITERVLQEYKVGKKSRADVSRIFDTVHAEINDKVLPYFHFNSSSGEIGVISYAMQNPDAFCVIDEEFARQICRAFNIHLTGTVGIMKRMRTNLDQSSASAQNRFPCPNGEKALFLNEKDHDRYCNCLRRFHEKPPTKKQLKELRERCECPSCQELRTLRITIPDSLGEL